MSNTIPPQEVAIEFLRLLNMTITDGDNLIPVLRGSLLLKHWFGEDGRPAADIDLECFEGPRPESLCEEDEEDYGYMGDGVGPFGDYESLVDYGKAMCRYAAETTQVYGWSPRAKDLEIVFQQTEAPEDGSSLWTYGTPGERYYTGWEWTARRLTGRLQIDIAQAGSYRLDDISVADIELVALNGTAFRIRAYTPEMLLAAKFSWLMRGLTSQLNGSGDLVWTGEPKDLFDAHLLLTKADLRADEFQKALLAVGAEDALDWNHLEAILNVRRVKLTDADFANWGAFHAQHKALITCGPVEMLHTVADRLKPLLGDFYLPEEMPFLLAVNADPIDEFNYLVYADWLEDHGDKRSDFLRLFATFYFREDQPPEEHSRTRSALQNALRSTSQPWLRQLFGTSSRFQEIRQRIEGDVS